MAVALATAYRRFIVPSFSGFEFQPLATGDKILQEGAKMSSWSGLADFSFCFEEPCEILSCLGAGTAMDVGADFFIP